MNSICWSIDTSVAAENPSDCVLYLKIPCRAWIVISISHAPSQDRDPPDADPPDTDALMEVSRCRQASVISFGGSFEFRWQFRRRNSWSNYGMSLDDLRF
jgi:hypothetical protein